MQKIKDFWLWFQENQEAFYNLHNSSEVSKAYYSNMLTEYLELFDECLGFEISLPNGPFDRAVLTLSANGNPNGAMYVVNLINAAPNVPKWKFQAFYQPKHDLEECKQGLDEPYEFEGLTIKASDIKWFPMDDEGASGKSNLMCFVMGYNETVKEIGEELYCSFIHTILQDVLGEAALYRHIDGIYIEDLLFSNFHPYDIHELPDYFGLEVKVSL
ncbi:hypothetical protein [Mangrovimonas xylaniphaga]|uniref:hypothetical protein n=1 Tax=Mangrovimonas xylaniphaga TaxID=1645915 RepID=UPI0006B6011A|nr:hypothetical protein [Mangrovimonas xylaniphaga]